jgi:protease I
MRSRILFVALIAGLAWATCAGCKPKTPEAEPEEKPPEAEVEAEKPAEQEAEKPPEPEDLPLKGKQVVMVIACKDFRDEELAEPRKVLEEAGAQVTVASTSTEGCKGMLGAEVTPDSLVDALDADSFDAAVFVGGSGSAAYYEDEAVLEFARQADKEGLVIGAICLAPGILARAGILDGIKATAYDAEKARKALEEGGATYTGDPVTVDGVIVTGNGPDAAKPFGGKLVEVLSD